MDGSRAAARSRPMPLITTLIPAYKKAHLAEALIGLRRQSIKDFKVIVSDDSPDDEITSLLREGSLKEAASGLDLEVVRGPKNGRRNHQFLLTQWYGSTPFVHFHLDDDVIYPDFYRQHLEAHAGGPYSISVSRRWFGDVTAAPTQGVALPDCVAGSPLHVVPVDASTLFKTTVPTCTNWLGEFTNMLISADAALLWPLPPEEGISYYGWMDVGMLLTAVQQRPVAVIREHLSVFRRHPEQSTHRYHNHSGRVASLAWAVYAMQAWREQRISHRDAVAAISHTVMQCFKRHGEDDPVINEFYDIVQHEGVSLDRLIRAFTPFWQTLLRSDDSTFPHSVPTHHSDCLEFA